MDTLDLALEARAGKQAPIFDPLDAALLTRSTETVSPSKPAAPSRTVLGALKDNSMTGGLESIATLGSGALSSVAGGLAGLLGTALPGPEGQGANWARALQEGGTYQPRTEAGKELIGGAAAIQEPFNAAGEWAQRGTEETGVVGSQAMGAISKAGLENLPLLLGMRVPGTAGAMTQGERLGAQLAGKPVEAPVAMPTPPPSKVPAMVPTNSSRASLMQPKPQAAPAPLALAEPSAPVVQMPPPSTVGRLPVEQQVQRLADLQEIGLKKGSIRESSVTGDLRGNENDFGAQKMDTPTGNAMKGQFTAERAALKDYGEKTVASTGGTPGADPYARGTAILQPLEGVQSLYNQGIKKLYKTADEAAAGQAAVPLEAVGDLLMNQRSAFVGTTEGAALLRGVASRMRELGITADAQATVSQMERLRQYVGQQWSPRTGTAVSALKDAIDADVFKSAGADIYQQARALRAERGRVLDEPAGISALLDSSGPAGINRKVQIEKMGDAIATLPTDQLAHLKQVLTGGMPTEALQAQGMAAWNEIQAHIAQKVIGAADQGTKWSPLAIDKAINAMGQTRFDLVFSREQQAKLLTLQRAGHYLQPHDINPSGTASAMKRTDSLMTTAPKYVGATLGTAIGGPAGAGAGWAMGSALGAGVKKLQTTAEARRLGRMLEGNIKPPKE